LTKLPTAKQSEPTGHWLMRTWTTCVQSRIHDAVRRCLL